MGRLATEERRRPSRRRRWSGSGVQASLGAVFVALLVLAAVALVDASERSRFQQYKRSDALMYASVVRAKVEGALHKRLRIAYGLSAFARSQFDQLPANFYQFAEALMRTGVAGIRSLQLSPGAVVRYVYPYKSNEKVMGHDLLADPARREAVLRAIEQRMFIVAGPLDLLQGGRGLIARLPIYRDTAAGEIFWGFATIVLDIEPLLAEAGLASGTDSSYRVALRGTDGLGEDGEQFFGEPDVFYADPVLLDVALPAGRWQVAVVPKAGWPRTAPASAIIWSIGAVLAVVASGLTAVVLLAPDALRREVARATEALRDSEEQFRRVAESATDAIVSADGSGHIVFWNQAAADAFGYTGAEAIGQPVSILIPPRLRAEHEEAFARSAASPMASRPRHSFAAFGLRKDGGEFPLELSSARWTSGGATYHTAIIRDVSERKAAERQQARLQERFHQAQRMEAIGTLASGAAHEFNNILNSIMANADSAAMQLGSEHPAAQAVAEVQEGAWRAADIVRQLLVFSEKSPEDLQPVAIAEVVAETLDELRRSVPPWIAITGAIPDAAGLVLAEPQQLRQMLSNLCINAMQAMAGGAGTIGVTVTRLDGAHCSLAELCPGQPDSAALDVGHVERWPAFAVTVADTGSGMTRAVLDRAFEPFYTTKPVGSGSGLGLSVVHGIVQRCGGAVSVRTCPGKGTMISVYLPMIQAEVPEPAAT